MDLKLVLRLLLVAVITGASSTAVWLAWHGELGAGAAALVVIAAIPALRLLPRGQRVGGWCVAIWAGLAAVVLARSDALVALLDVDRWRLALYGALAYLVVAALGFWATRGGRQGSGIEQNKGNA